MLKDKCYLGTISKQSSNKCEQLLDKIDEVINKKLSFK